MNPIKTDSQLLADFAATRDPAAFRQLVERHVDMVYGAACRQVRAGGGAVLADDITQAVFIVLLQRAQHIRDGKLLAAWLLQTTRFCARDAMKSERRRKKREADVSTERDRTQEPVALEEIEGLLDEGLSRLTPNDREALVQRFWKERELGEVAAHLGISEEAAKKRITRAIGKLREFLDRRGQAAGAGAVAAVLSQTGRGMAPAAVKTACAALGVKGTAASIGAAGIAKGALILMKISKMLVAVGCVGLVAGGAAVSMIVASRISGLAAAPSEQATAAAKSESSAASIASAGAYYVIGPGTRSRVYSLTGRQVTLSSALAEAGIPRDQNAAVDLIRRQGNEQITTRLVMADVASGKQQDPVLLPNDLLNVRPITDVCYIVGPVPRPGVFSVVAETNKVSLFLQASGFTLDVNNQPELWLVRQGVASESIDKLPPQTAANMALQAGDILIVGNIPSYDSVASALRPAVAASTDIPARAHSTRRAPVTGEPGSVVGQYTLRGTTRTNGRFMILGRPMTVLQAVAAATLGEGMLWPDRVYVRRQNGITREVRLKSVLIGTDGDSYVQDGDEIAVTSSYSILGENAGTYTMNDGLLSVREALVQAQIFGLPPGKGLSLIRRTSSGKLDSQELKVGADLTGPGSDLKVQVDDILSLSVEKP